ncbi:AsmA family protein [Allorhizobium pseudoryzae]|uniref:AsmA family protein n=1 Tax=Allorhizobium pseudoryzae TaxID=379684 RepID=UPI003CFEFB89
MTIYRPGKNLLRIALMSGGSILLLILMFRLVAPVLVSSAMVRERMEVAVEAWLGHDVIIAEDPDLQFWPRPLITLRDITIRAEDRDNAEILGHVGALSARFSLLDALSGSPVFRDFTLTSPDLTVKLDQNNHVNWSSSGLLGQALRKAADEQPLEPEESKTVIGDVTITGGRLRLEDHQRQVLVMENIGGMLIWPTLSSSAQLKLRTDIRGQSFDLAFSSPKPLLLLGGRNASLTANLTSTLVTGTFSGTANLATYAFFSGDLQLSVPAVDGLARWAEMPIHTADRLTNLSLSAQLATMGNVLRFDKLQVRANGTEGHGVMDLMAASGDRPRRVTGTLAFDSLDLWALVTALSADQRDPDESVAAHDPITDRQLGFDVRFSAGEASLGPLSLANVAVSVLADPKRTQVEILDSDLLTGSLTAQLQMQQQAPRTKARLSIRGVNLSTLAGQMALKGPTINAPAALDLTFTTAGAITQAPGNDLAGTLKLTAQAGEIDGLSLAELRTLAAKGSYFSLEQARSGSTDFQSLQVVAKIVGGNAEIETGTLANETQSLSVTGVIPYRTQSLALSAALIDKAVDKPPINLFVGGAWPNPVLWPVMPDREGQSTP